MHPFGETKGNRCSKQKYGNWASAIPARNAPTSTESPIAPANPVTRKHQKRAQIKIVSGFRDAQAKGLGNDRWHFHQLTQKCKYRGYRDYQPQVKEQ